MEKHESHHIFRQTFPGDFLLLFFSWKTNANSKNNQLLAEKLVKIYIITALLQFAEVLVPCVLEVEVKKFQLINIIVIINILFL